MEAERTIIVSIPEKCYVSPNPKNEFPFSFYFFITYGYLGLDKLNKNSLSESCDRAITTPQLRISGFQKLLNEDKIDDFIRNLTKEGDEDWTITKSSLNSDILIKYTGIDDEFPPDFHFSAATEKFISTAKENTVVSLKVSVENFIGINDHSYIINTKVNYVPWAKSIKFSSPSVDINTNATVEYEYMGDDSDKILFQNGNDVKSARSPYITLIEKPSLFTLQVSNRSGISDITTAHIDVNPPKIKSFTPSKYYFSKGESVKLSWVLESVKSVNLINFDESTDSYIESGAVVYPKLKFGTTSVSYTLLANGYLNGQPYAATDMIVLTETCWQNENMTSGLFTGDIYSGTEYNNRIFMRDGKFYCYVHPKLYKSEDCINWTEFSINDKSDNSFIPISAGYYENIACIMGKQESGNRLNIALYDFDTSKWSCSSAGKYCNSVKGCFAFSQKYKRYAEILINGIMVTNCNSTGKWNEGTVMIKAEQDKKLISGDFCFYKNMFYAAMLCDDKRFYVYEITDDMESFIFSCKAGDNDSFIRFVQTDNNLYTVTGESITSVKNRKAADVFMPGKGETGKPWLGGYKNDRLFGIYPDKKLWIFNEREY